ncbi:GH1 family beta-glucosidase [Streptacidiphilus anmyonensis]|uniref:GH1 family beta-glucosidase n=1 Tax=Streptacidiphilus anmyonensis TaxID=405782 RepID=UPI0005A81C3F|nr:GH1 family beta-glucosidase [Streptacidiphilus anmyonensis]
MVNRSADPTTPLPRFPADFVWGASTAAYQIEGAAEEDGKGPSIWDAFVRRPGAVRDGHTGATACDHYHRFGEDVALMRRLGLDAYRFSVSWPRVLPSGTGRVEPRGLDFYDRLVDALLDAGIEPTPTLFHWDLPQALEDQGGWMSRDTAYRLGEYAAVVAERLGDRVRRWITLNEPFVHMSFGYGFGVHAPGRALLLGAVPVAHHQLLGHGLAVAAIRAAAGPDGTQVLIANNCSPVRLRPDAASEADRLAADAYDTLHNRLFNDPLLTGSYPDLSVYGLSDPSWGGIVRDEDLKVIAAPLDGLGINYYNPSWITAPADPASGLPFDLVEPQETYRRTAFDWPVVPDGLTDLLLGLKARYGEALPPVWITENGCSEPAGLDDAARVDYLAGHVDAVARARAQGVDVRGYFTWSLLDNFEWAEGYHQRFGLVEVDFATQARTPRASFEWYRALIAAQKPQKS